MHRSVVDAVLTVVKTTCLGRNKAKALLPSLAGKVWEAIAQCKSIPSSNRQAAKRSMVRLAVVIKDTVNEMREGIDSSAAAGFRSLDEPVSNLDGSEPDEDADWFEDCDDTLLSEVEAARAMNGVKLFEQSLRLVEASMECAASVSDDRLSPLSNAVTKSLVGCVAKLRDCVVQLAYALEAEQVSALRQVCGL